MTGTAPATVTLQRATGMDLDAVMAIMDEAFDPRFGEAWTRPQCAGILPMHGVEMTLATVGEQAVGFSLVRTVAGESELLLLGVAPGWQGQGIGKALVASFIEHGRAAGARHLHLEVRDGNAAYQLYCRAGFHLVGRRPNYYRGPGAQQFDALTMALDI